MSDTEDRVPSFPAGTFVGKADWEAVAIGWNNDKTSEQISVRIRCTGTDKDIRGKSILWFGSFANQQAIDITSKALKAMGWDGESPIGLPGGDDGALAGLGSVEVEFVVKHETYQGKTRAKVAFVNAINARFEFKERLDQKALTSLNARVMRHIGATTDARPVQRSAQPQASGTRHTTQRTDPRAPATTPIASHPPVMAPVSDEDRLRAIDRGEEARIQGELLGAPGVRDPNDDRADDGFADDDIPF